MASDVDICNMALSHVGSDAIITSIDPSDGTVEAGHCARFYPQARAELLENFRWGFASKRQQLNPVVNISDAWAFAYAVPSDALRPLRLLQSGSAAASGDIFDLDTTYPLVLPNERGGAEFEIEGTTLFANEEEPVLLYTTDVTDTGRFTPTFRTALSYLLASFLAGPLIKGGEGARTALKLREIANGVANSAAAINANSAREPALQMSETVQARR